MALERRSELQVLVDSRSRLAPVEAEGRQGSCRLADVPLDGMQSEAAIGDVGRADVLGRRDEVADANRDEGAEWNLKRYGS